MWSNIFRFIMIHVWPCFSPWYLIDNLQMFSIRYEIFNKKLFDRFIFTRILKKIIQSSLYSAVTFGIQEIWLHKTIDAYLISVDNGHLYHVTPIYKGDHWFKINFVLNKCLTRETFWIIEIAGFKWNFYFFIK